MFDALEPGYSMFNYAAASVDLWSHFTLKNIVII